MTTIIRGRPKKVRYIQRKPKALMFSPRGKPGRPEEVVLSIDEYEAVKLADHQDFSQAQGAQAMNISRPTFGRILRSGRKKLADAIINGKTIKITYEDVQVGVRKVDLRVETLSEEIDKFTKRNKRLSADVATVEET